MLLKDLFGLDNIKNKTLLYLFFKDLVLTIIEKFSSINLNFKTIV